MIGIWRATLALAVLSIILAGCGGAEPTPAPATAVVEASETLETAQSYADLANTAWQVEAFGGPDDRLPVIPDSFPSLHFMLERYNGYSGCNWFLGVYELEGSELTLFTPAMTQGGCNDDALIEQGATYIGSLEIINRYELVDDTLRLFTDAEQLMITLSPLEGLPFEGTTWELRFFSTEPSIWQPYIPGTIITAQFADGQLTGNAGCNDYTATYTRSEGQLTLSELSSTRNTCDEPEGVMGQESAYLSMLANTGSAIESGRSLELLAADGTPMLLYHGR